VSGLYVYAIAGGALDESLGDGLAGEPLRRLGRGPVWAIAGELPEPPRPDPASLQAHDATVRRLAAQVPRLLPARFGQFLADQKALDAWLAAHARDLAAALDQVAGCVQMTLRVFSGSDLPETMPALEPEAQAPAVEGGPGTRYLELRRRDVEQQHALPEIAPLREALRPLLRGERIERATAPGRLRATAYDLIAGGAVAEYSRIVSETAPSLPAFRITASGPWPPYAFAPRAVA
jgi:hypothetical protein